MLAGARRAGAWRLPMAAAVLLMLATLAAGPAGSSSHCSTQASADLIRDCETLLELRDELAGDSNALDDWDGSTPLDSWTGIYARSLDGVTHMDFANVDVQLNGKLPAEVANLSNLEVLNLTGTKLSGTIPQELGNLGSLQYLYLSQNRLTGSIPAELGNLSNLIDMGLEDNRLTGEIPGELGNLSSLQLLYLSGNQLTGEIPQELGDLVNLQELILSTNRLTGSIPYELRSLGNLQYLYLNNNQLTGTIPPELSQLTELRRLFLYNNQLSSAIPARLSNIGANLTHLYLHNNKLTGGIPTELSSLASLEVLSLHRNPNLGSSIPSELGNLGRLRQLLLDKSGLTGPIPAELGNLSKLQVLGLSCNQLEGIVPNDLGDAGNAVTGEDADGNPLKTQIYLQGNDLVDAEGAPLRRDAQLPASLRSVGEGATKRMSPELKVTLTGRCLGDPPPAAEPKAKSKPKSTPTPTPAPTPAVIGATAAAEAIVPPEDGAPLRLERHDQPDTVIELAIGSTSADRSEVILGGIIRDAADGQTYLIVRREPHDTDGAVVRRWVPPDSPLVGQIPWPEIIARYTVPAAVLAAIPLDQLPTVPGQAVRFVTGDDPRIFRWDGETHQWRHVPDLATFQALGLYWCDVTAAATNFLARLPDGMLGPPYPASAEPVRPDYPTCRTA